MFGRSNVRCIDCGFLARRCEVDIDGKPTRGIIAFHHWGLTEMPAAVRNPLDLNKSGHGLLCEKGVINMHAVQDDARLTALVNERRACDWYEPNADLSFAQHAQSRHDRREFQRRMWLDRGVFAALAAGITFLFTWVLPHVLP